MDQDSQKGHESGHDINTFSCFDPQVWDRVSSKGGLTKSTRVLMDIDLKNGLYKSEFALENASTKVRSGKTPANPFESLEYPNRLVLLNHKSFYHHHC